jgi:acyl carrier protein
MMENSSAYAIVHPHFATIPNHPLFCEASSSVLRGKRMGSLSPFELEVACLLVETLNLEDVKPEEIDPEAPLFGEGLGLDSIDALELALAVSTAYGVQLRSDDTESNTRIFASLRALSEHIERSRTK